MNHVHWIGFVKTGTLCSTIVHFLGAASGISAPYPIQCSLSVFGDGIETKSVALEGMRLYQPDGVKINDVFPFLKDSTKTHGLLIELSCVQQRIDLSPTNCFIEILEQGVRTVYAAQPLHKERSHEMLISLSEDSAIATTAMCVHAPGPGNAMTLTPSLSVPRSSVKEIQFSQLTDTPEEITDAAWGQQKTKRLSVQGAELEHCGVFLCSYDRSYNSLLGVSAL